MSCSSLHGVLLSADVSSPLGNVFFFIKIRLYPNQNDFYSLKIQSFFIYFFAKSYLHIILIVVRKQHIISSNNVVQFDKIFIYCLFFIINKIDKKKKYSQGDLCALKFGLTVFVIKIVANPIFINLNTPRYITLYIIRKPNYAYK